MSTKQTDAHNSRQEDIIIDFATKLEEDFTEADWLYLNYRDDEDLPEKTFLVIKDLYKKHIKEHTEADREDYLTNKYMHD